MLQLASVQEQITVTSDSPVVETTRAEQSTLINQKAMSGLPNNGRNFLSFMQLTPGVTIVQGPDGDEISVNGQKGINNNIAVDGADFNNPFFGEQRGGQRPAFTFNQDAVKEMVVVADGAAPEFGRSGAGFINVVTKSGTNAPSGTAHFFFKTDGLSSENSDGEKFPFDQQQYGATFGGPLKKDRCSSSWRTTSSSSTRPSSSTRTASSRGSWTISPASAVPDENGTIDRTNDARVFLGKVDYQLNPSNLFTIRYNYTWSEQQNGTFDVDSWGRSANAVERGFSNAVSGSLATTLSGTMLNEFRFQFAREDRPRPYGGPNITGQSRPFPDTAFDFGSGYRFGDAVLHPGRVQRHALPDRQQPVLDQGPPHGQGRLRVQPRQLVADLHRVRQRPLRLREHRRVPQLRAARPDVRRVFRRLHQRDRQLPGRAPSITGPAAAVPAAGGRRRAVGRGGGHAGHPADWNRPCSSRTSGSPTRT